MTEISYIFVELIGLCTSINCFGWAYNEAPPIYNDGMVYWTSVNILLMEGGGGHQIWIIWDIMATNNSSAEFNRCGK